MLIEQIKDIISKFDDKEFIQSIENGEDDKEINIYIGSENSFDEDVSIIKTNYNVNGVDGTIALIGPKRMDYDRVITLLNYIKDNLDN